MNTQLTDLDISEYTSLTDLDCSYNQHKDLNLSQNTALKFLSCSSKYCMFWNWEVTYSAVLIINPGHNGVWYAFVFPPKAAAMPSTLALQLSLSLKLLHLKKHAVNSALKRVIHILSFTREALQRQIDGDWNRQSSSQDRAILQLRSGSLPARIGQSSNWDRKSSVQDRAIFVPAVAAFIYFLLLSIFRCNISGRNTYTKAEHGYIAVYFLLMK